MNRLTLKNLNNMYQGIFLDLDGTVRKTRSGETFPKNSNDWYIPKEVLIFFSEYHKERWKLSIDFVVGIITNQGGVGAGYQSEEEVLKGIKKVSAYLKIPMDWIRWEFFWSEDEAERLAHPRRKPNVGMLQELHKQTEEYFNLEGYETPILFVGDREEDMQLARNFGCDYLHPDQFFEDLDKIPPFLVGGSQIL